jgi:hypothetical protein
MIVALTMAFGFLLAPLADDATQIAVKLTTDGATNFDRKDAKTLAESYTEDAMLTLVVKEKDSDGLKTEIKRGRGEIQASYESLFKDAGVIHSHNTVEHARRINDNILVITGVFEPGLFNDAIKVAFVQTRVRQNDKWLISNMQIFLLEQK